ncbi:MAG: hypothetical protein Q9170_004361 [Blastenia crenularia]
MTTTSNGSCVSIPVLLLKNPSSGQSDAYTTHLSSNPPSPTTTYLALHVPVLEHNYYSEPILTVLASIYKDHPLEGTIPKLAYGGFIFTSQRAVESFAFALDRLSSSLKSSRTDNESYTMQQLKQLSVPLYAVGPATALALDTIRQRYLPHCTIRGGDNAGTAELLAGLILNDYRSSSSEPAISGKKKLLFLTGAKHRDIIPKTLTSSEEGIDVETMIVYSSTESQSFASDISTALGETATAPVRWTVIFSPTAGEQLLRALGWLDEGSLKVHGSEHLCWEERKTFITSIGPTTGDYMKRRFGFEVDVCAEKPSPEGVRKGIEGFMLLKGLIP